MSSRSAVVLVVLFVAIIAFCFAGVFAAMTGTYHLNFGNNDTNQTQFFGNMTNPSSDSSHSSSSGSVETYKDTKTQSSSDVETKEDTNPTPTPTPTPTPEPSPSPNGTA
jgi:cytoskeletal protein RodZ